MYTFDMINTGANTGLHKHIHTFHGTHNIPDGRPSGDGSSACRFVTVFWLASLACPWWLSIFIAWVSLVWCQDVVEIVWSRLSALPFNLCLSRGKLKHEKHVVRVRLNVSLSVQCADFFAEALGLLVKTGALLWRMIQSWWHWLRVNAITCCSPKKGVDVVILTGSLFLYTSVDGGLGKCAAWSWE